MNKTIGLLACALTVSLFSLTANARGPGSGSGGAGNAGAAGGGFAGGSSGSSGGGSAGQSKANNPPASSQAQENSNGRFAQDREFGLDRAQERMSDQGLANERATDNYGNPIKRKQSDINQEPSIPYRQDRDRLNN